MSGPAARPARTHLRLALAGLLLAGHAAVAGGPEVTLTAAPDGVPLCIAEAGNPAGPPVVLIHGFSQSHAVFTRQFNSPLADEFRLLALDLRGHGCSGKPWTEAAYQAARPWADDIATLLRERRVERPVVLAGWSAGGHWIMDYLRERGGAGVAGVVMAGSHGGLMPARINPALAESGQALRAANLSFPPDLAQGLARAEQFPARMAATPLPDEVARIMSASTLMLPAYARRAMATRAMDNTDLAGALRLPVLFILGDRDPAATPAQMRALAAELPQATVAVFEGAGHSTFAEQPARFNDTLAAFIRRVQPPPGP